MDWEDIKRDRERGEGLVVVPKKKSPWSILMRYFVIAFYMVFFTWGTFLYLNGDIELIRDMEGVIAKLQGLTFGHAIELRVNHLLRYHPLVDTHIDLPELARWQFKNQINGDDFAFDKEGFMGHLDIPRMQKGHLGGAFWSVYTSCPADWNDTSAVGTLLQTRESLQQIDVAKRIVEKYPKAMAISASVKDFIKSFKAGKIAGVLGAEGLHQIGNSIAALRQYHALGVRYMTLTHFCNNKFADSCSVAPWHNGLSSEGVDVVKEMNRIGMIVDLSHTSAETMRDALNASTAPVIFSHSGARGIFNHERNAPDDVLDLLKRNGGVINVVFMPEYIGPDYTQVTLDTVVDHILYIVDRIGWKHVGIGSDFDGVEHLPDGLKSVSDYPALVRRVIERAKPVRDRDIIGFIGGNVLRVWKEVERESERLQKHGALPYEPNEL